jgi:hypothetical protein
MPAHVRNDDVVRTAARLMVAAAKQRLRKAKLRYKKINRLKALPRIRYVYVNANYTNPVTLNKVPSGPTVYQVKDPRTGRLDFFDKVTFWNLMRQYSPNIKNNYNLMMAFPRRALFPNPATRTGITTRNIERVVARPKPKTPTRSAAARKIVSALRKKVAARKAASPKKKSVRKSH